MIGYKRLMQPLSQRILAGSYGRGSIAPSASAVPGGALAGLKIGRGLNILTKQQIQILMPYLGRIDTADDMVVYRSGRLER